MDREASSRRGRGSSISDAICMMERTSNVNIIPRNGSAPLARVTCETTGRSMVVSIDCPGPLVDGVLAKQDLLGALRHHAETKVVDTVQRLGWSRPPVQRERGNAGVVVAVGLDKGSDDASQRAYRRTVGRIWPSLL